VILPRYPRTQHFSGSKESDQISEKEFEKFLEEYSRYGTICTVEEKIDGSCVAIGLDNGRFEVYHRNTPAVGSEFDLLKAWIAKHETELYYTLGERYIMYGEWMQRCHTIFYNQLPGYFVEYDIYDIDRNRFLSTPARRRVLWANGIQTFIHPVINIEPVIGQSNYTIGSSENLSTSRFQVDTSGLMEGIYIKIEIDDVCTERYKFIRKSFLERLLKSEHWSKRYPPILNQLSSPT
jgi:hypothetical protein